MMSYFYNHNHNHNHKHTINHNPENKVASRTTEHVAHFTTETFDNDACTLTCIVCNATIQYKELHKCTQRDGVDIISVHPL